MGRSLASPAAAIATIVLLAACGGSSGPPAAHMPTATTAQTRQASPSPVATDGRACTSSNLTAVYLGQDGATRDVVLSFALRNRGTATCHTYGWPAVKFLGAGGRGLRTQSRRVTKDILGATPASVITLAPGRQASFRVIAPGGDPGGGGAGCATAHALRIIAPDDTARMSVRIPGGAHECVSATVSPLQPGGSA